MILLLSLYSAISAFNHPELKWKSVSTEHFIINYYDALEPLVYPTWKISEEVYKAISSAYGYTSTSKINISIADYDDYSNGWAEWTSANIMIWATDLKFDLRSNTTWLRNVITHELTHIMSLEVKKKMQLLSMSISMVASSPDETFVLSEPFAKITMYPSWFSEGIAQLESEAQGNDCWDSRRDMLLRSAVLDGKLLSLDEMGNFNHDALGRELVYNQGFSFIKYIEHVIGKEKLRNLFKQGSEDRLVFEYFFVESTGLSLTKLYDDWRDSLKREYEKITQIDKTEDKIVSSKGIYNLNPKVSPDGKLVAYFSSGKDDGLRTDLYVKEIATNKVIVKERYAHTAFTFSSQSDGIYFVKSRNPNSNGSYYNDIFYKELYKGGQKRLTYNARVYDCVATSDENELLCVRYRNNAFNVERLSLKTVTFSTVLKGNPGEPYGTISVNPNNSKEIVVSQIVDGKSRLFSWNGMEIIPIGPSVGQEESPFYATDGRIYYSADYDGIFNIYSIDSNGGDLKRHTNTVGGYFSPTVGNDGSLFTSRYGSSGFSIVQATPFSTNFSIDSEYRCTFFPLPTPKGNVVIKAHPYRGSMLRSVWEMALFGRYQTNRSLLSGQYIPDIDTASLIVGAAIQSYKSDALHKKYLALNLQLGVIRDLSEVKDSTALAIAPFVTNDVLNPDALYYKNSNQKLKPDNAYKKQEKAWLQPVYSSQSDNSKPDSAEVDPPRIMPFFTPGLMFGTEIGDATFSGSAQVALAMLVLPAEVNAVFSVSYPFSRGLNSSISTNLTWRPFDEIATLFIPFVLSWSRNGYYIEDIMYNDGERTSIAGMFTPIFFPVKMVNTVNGDEITEYKGTRGSVTGLNVWQSFALWKYSTLQLALNAALVHYDLMLSEGEEEKFPKGSHYFYDGDVGAKWVFPVVRTVNKRFVYYWDALYGSVGYSLSMLASRKFLDNESFSRKLLSDADYDKEISVEQTVSASLTFGHTKEYLFNKQYNIDFNYEILRRKASFLVNLGF